MSGVPLQLPTSASPFQVIGDVVSYREQMKWFLTTPTPAFSSSRCMQESITHLLYLSAGSKRCQRMPRATGAGELRVRRLPNPTMNENKMHQLCSIFDGAFVECKLAKIIKLEAWVS
jgi:hypothetical protein